jgi:hypothetical protein
LPAASTLRFAHSSESEKPKTLDCPLNPAYTPTLSSNSNRPLCAFGTTHHPASERSGEKS